MWDCAAFAALAKDTDDAATWVRLDHIALIGNFLPRKCGIATYTTERIRRCATGFPTCTVDVYAMDDRPEAIRLSPRGRSRIDPAGRRVAYIDAARAIEAAARRRLWLQHEYGIFGGPAGEC